LEDNEMKALVERLEPGVFRLIYEAASERNRTRLLQALPPDQAARFVREFLVGPQKQATVSVSTTIPPVAPSEPQEARTDTP
jgi:hypothetical protein